MTCENCDGLGFFFTTGDTLERCDTCKQFKRDEEVVSFLSSFLPLKQIYVVLYRHKYGSETYVHVNEMTAQIQVGAIIREWIDEVHIESVRKEILKLLYQYEWVEAHRIWQGYQHEHMHELAEELDISSVRVYWPSDTKEFLDQARRSHQDTPGPVSRKRDLAALLARAAAGLETPGDLRDRELVELIEDLRVEEKAIKEEMGNDE